MDPNSQHQLWSLWKFKIHDGGRVVTKEEVKLNAAKWLRARFGSAGIGRVTRTRDGWLLEARFEGPVAYDPGYEASTRDMFQKQFVEKGFGPMAWSETEVRVLAGDKQDGKPRQQVIMLDGKLDM